jgi:N-acetylglutamate synthase-like GNAT family acetyltransferase
MRVRRYGDADREACRALWLELVETHRDLYEDPAVGGDDPAAGFDRHVDEFGTQDLWVADDGGEVLGLAGLVWHGDRAELEPVVVSERARGGGIGSALVDAAVSESRARRARYVFVQPTARNTAGIAFFHGRGFDVLAYVQLQLDLAERTRRPGERIAGLTFDV